MIQNGGFEDSLRYWLWTPGVGGYCESCNVKSYGPPDKQMCLFRYDATHSKLYQTVSIPHLNLHFGFHGKFQAVELNPSAKYWAFAAMVLEYRTAGNDYLGRTLFVLQLPHSSLVSTPTQHLIPVSDTLWHAYSITLADELANLPGIKPAQVQVVTVAALDSTNGCRIGHC